MVVSGDIPSSQQLGVCMREESLRCDSECVLSSSNPKLVE